MNPFDDPPPDDGPDRSDFRWVHVRDDRTTARLRLERIAFDAPDPEPVLDSPEELARVRQRVADLIQQNAAHPNPGSTTQPPAIEENP